MSPSDDIGINDSLAVAVRRGRGLGDILGIRGRVCLELRGPDGQVKQRVETDNLVVTAGKNQIADQLLASPTIGKPTHMEVGTGTTAPAVGQTALVTALDRNALTSKTRSTNIVTMVGTWAAGDATNSALTEAGIFNASSAGDMTARAVFTAIDKAAGDSLEITWTVTCG